MLKAWGCGLDSTDSRLGAMTDFCEHDNEVSGSIKSGGIFVSAEQL